MNHHSTIDDSPHIACFREIMSWVNSVLELDHILELILDTATRMMEVKASSKTSTLILGESGTGKELLARLIHQACSRKAMPMIVLNCAALPELLLEAELFGYEKGAFTGAMNQKVGKFELANGGTLFLDEISEMSPGMQAKLVRILEEGVFYRVGGIAPILSDVRVISATNRDIVLEVAEGRFREDLYYRLSVVQIYMPALRERKEDIPLLANYYMNIFKQESGLPRLKISRKAMERMMKYDWPGNIRELRNAIERAVVMGDGKRIMPEDLPFSDPKPMYPGIEVGLTLKDAMDKFKEEFIELNMKHTGVNESNAAEKMEIQRTYLSRLISQYNIPNSTKKFGRAQKLGESKPTEEEWNWGATKVLKRL